MKKTKHTRYLNQQGIFQTLVYTLIVSLLQSAAFANSPDTIVDSPRYLTGKIVPLRVVKFETKMVPNNCNKIFRAGMEDQLRKVWANCQEIGKMDPSDCQRDLFRYCVETSNKFQDLETGACGHMVGDADYLDKKSYSVNVNSQKTAQTENASVNADATRLALSLAERLKTNTGDLKRMQQEGKNLLFGASCRNSSSSKQYSRGASQLMGEVAKTQKFVNDFRTLKVMEAVQTRKNEMQSEKFAKEMKSSNPIIGMNSAGTISTMGKPAVTSNTSSSNGTNLETNVNTGTMITSTTNPSTSTNTNTSVQSNRKKNKTNWGPILAIGIPAAAILAYVAYSSMSERPGGESGSSTGGGLTDPPDNDSSNTGSAAPAEDPPKGEGNSETEKDQSKLVSPTGGTLEQAKIKVDPSFRDEEKRKIGNGVQLFPVCHLDKFKNLQFRNNPNLKWNGSNACLIGKQQADKLIELNPSCKSRGVQTAVVVHELFHVLGNRGMYAQYQKIYDNYGNCPVSSYSQRAKSMREDFAEAGRLALVPLSGEKISSTCADAKIQAVHKMIHSCSL